MVADYKFEDIDATLNHGQIFSNKVWKILIIVFYVFIGVVFAICLTVYIGFSVGLFDSDDLTDNIYLSVVSVIFLIGTVIGHVCLNSRKKRVDMWMKDAVLLKAKASSLGERLIVRNFLALKGVALKVTFKYNDRVYERQSMHKEDLLYMPVYKKYANKEITIAYSPQYDEVILIKPNCVNHVREQKF